MALSLTPIHPLSTYYRATRKPLPYPLHSECARAVVLGGDIFYSPNCSVMPKLPGNDRKPFYRDADKDCVDEIQQPLWWVEEMAYLPFVPKEPSFHVVPFDKLYSNPLNVRNLKREKRKRMDSHDILHWQSVEKLMQDIFYTLRSKYGIPEMKYVVSTTLVCNAEYDHSWQYIAAERRCRKWFAMWMGLLSFAIAVGQSSDQEDGSTPLPKWLHSLLRFYDEHVVASIRQELGLFSEYQPRAGVFLKLADAQANQPMIDFFVKWNVPVWYPWTEREERHLRDNPTLWNRWKPQLHLMQKAKSFLIKEPCPVADSEPWKEFLENRKRRASGMPISTKRKPPMKVFVWTKDDDRNWERKVVHKRDREEILHEFGANQKYYDELTNEWDCCEAMGAVSIEEMQQYAWDDDDEPICPISMPITDQYVSSGPSNAIDASSTTSTSQVTPQTASLIDTVTVDERSETNIPCLQVVLDDYYEPETYSPTDLLHVLYGFVHPTSRSNIRLENYPTNKQEANSVKLVCGITSISESYFASATGQAAMDFVMCLSQACQTPRNEIFDLASTNHEFLKKSMRLKYLRKLPGDIFVFKLGDCATVQWSLAVKGVNTVLLVLRLNEGWNDHQLAVELLNRGVEFYTLMRMRSFSPVELPMHIPRIRLSSRVFNDEDYQLYKQECNNLLCNPRIGRAALKHGGILWRLSVSNVGYSNVLSGPTATATLKNQCQSFNKGDEWIWIDDYLQESEKDIICGVYRVYTGQGTQQAIRSWWPTAKVWEENVRFPVWNDKLEDIYLARLQELENGNAMPLTSTEWRNIIRPQAVVRRTFLNSTKIAIEFLGSVTHL